MLDPEERKKIRNRILQARMALAADDRADLETAMFDLNAIARQLSELMLDQVEDGGGPLRPPRIHATRGKCSRPNHISSSTR